MDLSLIFAGLGVGLMIGMTGVGGGSLMTPILIFGFSISPAVAVGTDLLFAAMTKAGGIFSYMRHGVVNWKVVRRLAMGSLPATIITLLVLHYGQFDGDAQAALITHALGIALILTSSAILFKGVIGDWLQARQSNVAVTALYRLRTDAQYKAVSTIVTGILLGVMVTLSSVGAGALGAAVLLFLYPKMRGVEIVATDIAHAVPLTALAGLGHASVGTVDWHLLSMLVIGSLPGIYIGSHLGVRIPDKLMRPLLAVLLFGVGLKCLIG